MKKLLLVLALCGVMSPLIAMRSRYIQNTAGGVYNRLNSPVAVTFHFRGKYAGFAGGKELYEKGTATTITIPAQSWGDARDAVANKPFRVKVVVLGERTKLQKARGMIDDSVEIEDQCFDTILIEPNDSITSIRGFDVHINPCAPRRDDGGLSSLIGDIQLG